MPERDSALCGAGRRDRSALISIGTRPRIGPLKGLTLKRRRRVRKPRTKSNCCARSDKRAFRVLRGYPRSYSARTPASRTESNCADFDAFGGHAIDWKRVHHCPSPGTRFSAPTLYSVLSAGAPLALLAAVLAPAHPTISAFPTQFFGTLRAKARVWRAFGANTGTELCSRTVGQLAQLTLTTTLMKRSRAWPELRFEA